MNRTGTSEARTLTRAARDIQPRELLRKSQGVTVTHVQPPRHATRPPANHTADCDCSHACSRRPHITHPTHSDPCSLYQPLPTSRAEVKSRTQAPDARRWAELAWSAAGPCVDRCTSQNNLAALPAFTTRGRRAWVASAEPRLPCEQPRYWALASRLVWMPSELQMKTLNPLREDESEDATPRYRPTSEGEESAYLPESLERAGRAHTVERWRQNLVPEGSNGGARENERDRRRRIAQAKLADGHMLVDPDGAFRKKMGHRTDDDADLRCIRCAIPPWVWGAGRCLEFLVLVRRNCGYLLCC